ncbi:MAG TPA: acetamidase, partial [Firmicutes bacterium]|nr:acetamidase [Bacillota bacterium]
LEPMIGVIGVAPAAGEVSCGIPGVHGGNLDTNLIQENAEVFLPVWVEGGLLALGDLHALMGDGEIGISGAEAAGEVLIKIELIKGLGLAGPLVRSGGVLAVLCSGESLDAAAKGAVETMVELIRERTGKPAAEIAMLLSIAGKLAVSQAVNPLKTARFEMPLWLLEKYGFALE